MTDAKKPGKKYCNKCHELKVLCVCEPDPDGIRAAAEEMAELIHAGSWAFIPLKALCEKFIRREVDRERDIILAEIGMRYPDQYDPDTDEVIRNIENIIRIRQGGK